MTGHGFSISPATAAAPSPVTLVMPPGYLARAFVTDPCGKPVPGAYVTVAGHTATPHGLPAGTSFVDWQVMPVHQAAGSGGRVSLVLASRQTVGGHATSCPTGRSPYAGTVHHAAAPHQAPAAPSAGFLPLAGAAMGGALLVAAVVALWRLRRPRGRRRADGRLS